MQVNTTLSKLHEEICQGCRVCRSSGEDVWSIVYLNLKKSECPLHILEPSEWALSQADFLIMDRHRWFLVVKSISEMLRKKNRFWDEGFILDTGFILE